MDDYKIKNAMYMACNIIESSQSSLLAKKKSFDKFVMIKNSYSLDKKTKDGFNNIETNLKIKLQEISLLEYEIIYGRIKNLLNPEKDKLNKYVICQEFLIGKIEEYNKKSQIYIEIGHPRTLEMNSRIQRRIIKVTSELNVLENAS